MALKFFDIETLGSGVTVHIGKNRRTYNMRYVYDEKQLRTYVKHLIKDGYTYVGRDIQKDLNDAILKAWLHNDSLTDISIGEKTMTYCEFPVAGWFEEYKVPALKWRHPGQIPEIKKVIFNPPATIVMWEDGTKTVVKCRKGEEYSKEAGLAFCVMKKTYGGKFHRMFKDWCKE